MMVHVLWVPLARLVPAEIKGPIPLVLLCLHCTEQQLLGISFHLSASQVPREPLTVFHTEYDEPEIKKKNFKLPSPMCVIPFKDLGTVSKFSDATGMSSLLKLNTSNIT
jgi:hypothetical protein